jgi:hypothetical protein
MKKSFIVFLCIIAIAACSFLLFACNGDNGPPSENYPLPENLVIGIYNGETLLGTINNDVLNGAEQTTVRMQTVDSIDREFDRTYVAYSLTAVLQSMNITLPTFNQVTFGLTNGGTLTRNNLTSLANAYITIGMINADGFSVDTSSPRIIIDKTSNNHGGIIQNVASISVATIAEPEPDNGYDCTECDDEGCAECDEIDGDNGYDCTYCNDQGCTKCCEFCNAIGCVNCCERYNLSDYAIPNGLVINIDIQHNGTSLGTITNDVLENVQQMTVRMQTVNNAGTPFDNTYVAYSLIEILEYMNIALPEFNRVTFGTAPARAVGSQNDIFITIGFLRESGFEVDGGSVRGIPNSKSDAHGAITQNVTTINLTLV